MLLPDTPKILLLAQPNELQIVLHAWQRIPQRQSLHPVNSTLLINQLDNFNEPILVALSDAVLQDPELRTLFSSLEKRDSPQIHALSVLSLFEQYRNDYLRYGRYSS